MKRVLILDANQRSALAVTRSLGRQGVPVLTADEFSPSLAGASRYSQLHCQYPSPEHSPSQFIETLGKLVRKHNIDMLLPMTELTTTLVLKAKSLLPEIEIPFPGIETVNSLTNKCELIRMADKLNIPVPRTWHANHPDSLPVDLNDLNYPLILKPGKSWLLQQEKWGRFAVRIANDPVTAREILNEDPAFRAHPFMLQECVAGHGAGVFALYDHGKPLAFFAHIRLREKPPSGGVSVLSESVSVDPVLLTHACSLLDAVNWHGIAMVEFKVTQDATPYLMEINTRFWGSLQLAVDAGVDFPWLLYQMACGDKPGSVEDYTTGIRLRWLLGDLDNLYLTLRDKQCSKTKKLKSILQFLTPSPFKTRHEVNRWNDPAPAWHELKQYLRDILN